MKNLFIFFILSSVSLFGEIIESMTLRDIHTYADQETLIIFDLDNTIMEPIQDLGSDQWFTQKIRREVANGRPYDESLEEVLIQWMAIQNVTKMQLCEQGADELIRHLQDNNYVVMGLTTRGLGLSTCTLHQLNTLGVDLSLTSPTSEEVFVKNPRGVLFRDGVLFTAGTHKGHAFKKFISKIGFSPKKIIFINDKESHIKELFESLDEMGIPSIGLRYGVTDERVKNFRFDIADLQEAHFWKIISNTEAEQLLNPSIAQK